MSATSDLPTDYWSGLPIYELDNPLEKLQHMLMKSDIDNFESDDQRSSNLGVYFGNTRPKELQLITNFINENPEQNIRTSDVRDLNDKFDINMVNSDPNYIFRDDVQTKNNINTIKASNFTFAKNRDMFIVPPPLDIQQRILDLLNNK